MEMGQRVTVNRENEMERIVSEFGEKLLRYATSILYNHQDAEDAVQDVFLNYFQNSHRFDVKNVSAWLYKMTYNNCLDKRKMKSRRKLSFLEDVGEEPAVHMEDNLAITELMKALEPLKPQERALLYGRAVNEQSYEELSRIMGVSPSALRKQYERVKKKAIKLLDAQEHGYGESIVKPKEMPDTAKGVGYCEI